MADIFDTLAPDATQTPTPQGGGDIFDQISAPQPGVNISPNGRTVIGPKPDLKNRLLNVLPNVNPEALPNAIKGQPQIAKDLETIPTNFLNQLTMNHLRSMSNAGDANIPFEAKNPVINAAAKGAGVAGMVMSPLNKLAIMKALGPGNILAKAGQGALAGAAYAPNDNPLNMEGRAVQAGVNAVAGPAISKGIEAIAPSADQVTSKIVDLYKKAVRPTVAGRNAPALSEKYDNNILAGVDAIVKNQPNLNHTNEYGQPVERAPQTLPEFVDAGFKTMDDTFKQYDAMTKAATGKGISIPLQGIGTELKSAVNNFATKTHTPDVYQYANDVAAKYDKQGSLSPADVQQVTQKLNAILKNFYRNPSYQMTGRDEIDAMIAGKLRNAMDQEITKAQGPGYQQLKNQYGALSSIMKDVLRRSNALDNKSPDEGLGKFANIWITGKIVGGLAHGNPAGVATGIAELGAKNFMKWRGDANKMVKDIFKLAQSRKTFGGQGTFTPGKAPTSLNQLALPAPLPEYLKGRENIPPMYVPRETSVSDNPIPMGMDKPLALPAPLPKYLKDRENIPAIPKATGEAKFSPPDVIYLNGHSANAVTNQTNPNAYKPSTLNDLMSKDLEREALKKRTLGAGAVGLTALASSKESSAMSKVPIKDEDAIKTIIGEAENQGPKGMQDIASVIRNRGTLKGAYGLNSPRVVNKKYSPKIYAQAKKAWELSKTQNTSNGANHWFSAEDMKTPKVQMMIKGMKFVKKSGSQSLYKEGK